MQRTGRTQMSAQQMKLLDILASASSNSDTSRCAPAVPGAARNDTGRNTTVNELARSLAQVVGKPSPVVISPADVRRVPHLTEAPDVDVPENLNQHGHVVG